jgi:putative oxidoreductase
MLNQYDKYFFVIGRSLLGLYFIIPGVSKVILYDANLVIMEAKGVPISSILLPLTILLQIFGGFFLIFGKFLRLSSLTLFVLVIFINIYIHNFWDLSGDPSQGHETQNFFKNLGIAAGLLVLSSKED